MKTNCERCGSPTLGDEKAFICSFECTYCPRCAFELNLLCPDCGGELLQRPRRARTKSGPSASQAELVGYTLASAAWSISDVSEDLVPIAIVEQGDTRKEITLGGANHEDAIVKGRTSLHQAEDHLDRWALAYQSVSEDGNSEQILVESWDKSDSSRWVLSQEIRPFSAGQPFTFVESPVLSLNGDNASDEMTEQFLGMAEGGIAQHQMATEHWDEWRQDPEPVSTQQGA